MTCLFYDKDYLTKEVMTALSTMCEVRLPYHPGEQIPDSSSLSETGNHSK